jgi:hypothetical protein
MNLNDEVGSIKTRDEFVVFVESLRRNLAASPAEWENAQLGDFLEAMAAWASDMDGYYKNNQLPVPAVPTWTTFAQMLLAAKHYE